MNLNKIITKNIFEKLILLYILSVSLFVSIRFFDFYRESSRFYNLTKNYIKNSTEQLINEGEVLRLQMNIDQFLGLNNKENDQIICPKIFLDQRPIASVECKGLWTYKKSEAFILANGQTLSIQFGIDGTQFIITNLIMIASYSILLILLIFIFKKNIDQFSLQITSPLLKWSEWAKSLNLNNNFVTPKFTEEELKITEFSNFHKFNQQAFQIQKEFFNSKIIEEKAKFELEMAKRVSHDIRSPLIALKNLNENISFSEQKTKELFDSTVLRIDNIANDLLKKTHSFSEKDNFVESLKSLIEVKLIEFKRSNIVIKDSLEVVSLHQLKSTEQKILRIVSNLINNAVAAQERYGNVIIEIDLKKKNHQLILKINDNGPGIPLEIQKRIGQTEVTTKELSSDSGSGIGLLSAYQIINEIGGRIYFQSNQSGTQFTIELPISPKEILLIDDDKIVHLNWKKEAAKRNILIHHFYNGEEFLKNSSNFDFKIPIFIDKNIDKINGITLGEELKMKGFKNLYLQTGEDNLDCPSVFNEMFSKSFPYL